MTLSDGIKLAGMPAEISGAIRDDLPDLFKELGFKVGVEIGVGDGTFSEKLCKVGLKMYSVDPYLAYPEYTARSTQAEFDSLYERAREKLSPYDCTLIKKTSMDAVKDFKDGSIDFVYIDGHHGFKFVTEDICEWSKKVKKDGIISGHDYYFASAKNGYICQVKEAVITYTRTMHIGNWFVVGGGGSERRDKFRSYFWFNKW